MICGSRPASAAAFALSYSQLVPGNTGISILGFATFTAGTGQLSALYSALQTSPISWLMLQLYMFSSLFSYSAVMVSRPTLSSPSLRMGSSVVRPRKPMLTPSGLFSGLKIPSGASPSSTMKLP